MARVTDVEVKEIFDTDIDTTPFINTANALVTNKLASEGLDDDTLKQIELYLAAHFACAKDPRITNEKIGDASNTYQLPKNGSGLNATAYGEAAIMLDSTGILLNSTKQVAKLETLPTAVASWQ